MVNAVSLKIFDNSMNDYTKTESKLLFTLPFSQEDALKLQAIFIQPGVHVIHVKNIAEGRTITDIILKSLNYYHDIGLLSLEKDAPVYSLDIINCINSGNIIKKESHENLEDFFIANPYFDFIWVEGTKNFLEKYPLQNLKTMFSMIHAQERMSVVILLYEEI